jgi:hypothetical protein
MDLVGACTGIGLFFYSKNIRGKKDERRKIPDIHLAITE